MPIKPKLMVNIWLTVSLGFGTRPIAAGEEKEVLVDIT
jgi:hypothetical protein